MNVNCYCVCVLHFPKGNLTYSAFDLCTYPNPAKDDRATPKVLDRARTLRKIFTATQGDYGERNKTLRKQLGIPQRCTVRVEPMIVKGVPEPTDTH